MQYVTGVCPTGKRAYLKRRDAKVTARIMRDAGHGALYDYRCPECGYIHIGHRRWKAS